VSMRLFAIAFFISSMIVSYYVLNGIFYDLYTMGWLFNVIQYTYLGLAIIFIILGGINLTDWKSMITSAGPDKIIIKPEFMIPIPGRRKPVPWLIVLVLGFLTGGVLSFMLGVWPMGWDIYNYWAESASVGDVVHALLAIILYTFFILTPFLFVTAIFLLAMRSKKNQDFLLRIIPMVKILTASFFIAVGLGLSYIVLR
jgi:hypothetical protein